MSRSLRVAVVGTGEVSHQVASDLALTDGAELSAVSSRSIESAESFLAALGARARAFGDYAECLADPDVDLVYLGTPHATHHDLALRAIRAGKNVLVEKPLAMDAAAARDLAGAGRAAGVFLMEGMWTKFNAVIRRVFDLIGEGAVGEVRSVRASFGIPFPRDGSSRWRADLGGSSLLDQGIYPITLARVMLGDPTEIHAGGTVRPDGVDLTGHLTLGYPGGRFAQLSWSMVEFTDVSATISGTEGVISIHPAFWTPERATLMRSSGPGATVPEITEIEIEREGFGFVPMLRSVAETIAAGRIENALHPMSETIATAELMDRARALLVAGSA